MLGVGTQGDFQVSQLFIADIGKEDIVVIAIIVLAEENLDRKSVV